MKFCQGIIITQTGEESSVTLGLKETYIFAVIQFN